MCRSTGEIIPRRGKEDTLPHHPRGKISTFPQCGVTTLAEATDRNRPTLPRPWAARFGRRVYHIATR